ncbi:hypothetical protein LCGC14_1410150 [marine sediment metagenome]|uniref:Uncharacterized protein n=1 Tax=marine sediment metagenome TaxID=412755 RepID=A0A0F9JUK5_9ZZZZ
MNMNSNTLLRIYRGISIASYEVTSFNVKSI